MRPSIHRRGAPILALMLALLAPAALGLEGFDPHGSGPGYPDRANGRLTEPPSLNAHRIERGSIRIDGRLDEPDWVAAPAATGFTQFEPERRGEPCEDTVFKVIYDDDAIYFGVACFRYSGEPVTSCLSRRDNIRSSDRIRIYIDPYHDLTTGYHFRINPDGVKEDYYNYGDLYHDGSWDAVWEGDTHVDDEGWFAEVRIPFSSIRYRAAESMTWGFNVFQYVHSQGQRIAWSNWDRDQGGFMSRSGTITGIRGIRPPRQLEVTPYVTSRLTDPADPSASGFRGEDWDDFSNLGADIKYGVTADLTLNATWQPDFGQVEADPSVLNLSPYETYYDEKRPFFIEGAQFFWHPNFSVFYSRRIGTGSENSRIRFAGKLTGKMTGDISTAVLVAATDETGSGQAHNAFKGGDNRAFYAISRFGKQFHDGMHSVNLMQTAVIRDPDSSEQATRDGYTTGADFELNFGDRMYQMSGSFVGSIVDRHPSPEGPEIDPDPTFGTGGRFEIAKTSGDWLGSATVRLESDELDINDFGYITSSNHYAVQAVAEYDHNADDENCLFSNFHTHWRWYRSWIYADRSFEDPANPGSALWSYSRGHDLDHLFHACFNLNAQECWGINGGANYYPEGTDLHATRWTPDGTQRGPLLTRPFGYEAWLGFASDYRKDFSFDVNAEYDNWDHGAHAISCGAGVGWIQSSRINHTLTVGYESEFEDAQWVGNYENPGGGIGGVSYVFGELDQQTWDLTLRSSFLFDRDKSLELYLQPYLTVGDYTDGRELARPDSYEFRPYDGLDIATKDFSYGAVNLNLVYRWEYRPGSTIYLVWTHSRNKYETQGSHPGPGAFSNNFGTDPLVDNEAENRFQIKVSYWFPI